MRTTIVPRTEWIEKYKSEKNLESVCSLIDRFDGEIIFETDDLANKIAICPDIAFNWLQLFAASIARNNYFYDQIWGIDVWVLYQEDIIRFIDNNRNTILISEIGKKDLLNCLDALLHQFRQLFVSNNSLVKKSKAWKSRGLNPRFKYKSSITFKDGEQDGIMIRVIMDQGTSTILTAFPISDIFN